jgi:uncharacterized protein YukE
MTSPLWVNPGELTQRSRPFHERARQFRELRSYLAGILDRYPNAFGGDDLGTRFSATFMDGVRGIDARINAVAQRLEYTGDGLATNSRQFREADQNALRTSASLANRVDGSVIGSPASHRPGRH